MSKAVLFNNSGTLVFPPVNIEELKSYIDWTPFFLTWELKGRYPEILNNKSLVV